MRRNSWAFRSGLLTTNRSIACSTTAARSPSGLLPTCLSVGWTWLSSATTTSEILAITASPVRRATSCCSWLAVCLVQFYRPCLLWQSGRTPEQLGDIVIKATRYCVLLLCLIGLPLLVAPYLLLKLWVGQDYAIRSALFLQVLVLLRQRHTPARQPLRTRSPCDWPTASRHRCGSRRSSGQLRPEHLPGAEIRSYRCCNWNFGGSLCQRWVASHGKYENSLAQ